MPSEPTHGSDSGNSYLFVTKHQRDILFSPGLGWLIWDDARYDFDEKGEIWQMARDYVHELEETQEKVGRVAQSLKALNAIITLASKDKRIVVLGKELDLGIDILNVKNAEVNLRTQSACYGHRRENYFTKLVNINYVWDAKCPFWIDFLKMITGDDQEMMDFLQIAAGYSLTGDVSARKMFMAYGDGANGKTTFLETLSILAGQYACKMPADYLLERRPGAMTNDIRMLRGSRYAYSSEFPANAHMDEARVKELTGGDTITARFLRKEFVSFYPTHKSWTATNHKPILSGEDIAILDRMIVVPFDIRIPEHKLLAKDEVDRRIAIELEGILAWAIEGAAWWFSDGLKIPARIEEAIGEYQYDMDKTGKFLEACCVEGEDYTCAASDLYAAYEKHCKKIGDKKVSQTAFGVNMRKKGFTEKSGKKARAGISGSWIYKGIRIIPQSPLSDLQN